MFRGVWTGIKASLFPIVLAGCGAFDPKIAPAMMTMMTCSVLPALICV